MKAIRLLLLAAAALAGPATAAPFEDSMAQRTLACTACHGPQGRSGPDGYYPRIAGKPAGYLYNQLLHFREGRRHYGPMARLLDPLSEPYLLEIAQHFAGQEVPYAQPPRPQANAEVLARGRELALRGDGKQVPACASCHGTALTGVQPGTPGLLGLPRDYLQAQLGAWRTGQRQAHAPDCMAEVARSLSPQDLNAVASWLAAQPVPAQARPAERLPAPPPATCGSATAPSRPAAAAAAPTPTPAPAQAEPVARGAYLARVGNCMACHTARGGAPFAGGRAIDTPFGTVYAGNLTPDAKTGLGAWSADDFWRALHEGRSRGGRLLYPAFPYPNYTELTRADSDALFAYLRTVPAVARENTPHALRWPYRTQAALAAWRALYFSPGRFEADPRQSADWNRGAYLVRAVAHCSACHTTRNALGAPADMMDLSGGLIPMQNWYAPSLTAVSEAGLAQWTPQVIAQLLRTGVAPGSSVLGPMAEVVLHGTQHLSEADALAMGVFLQSLPPTPPPAPARAQPVPVAVAELGARLYRDHCVQCHGERGEGVRGAYPPLAGNRAVTLPVTANLVQVVLAGGFPPATAANPRPFGMPPYVMLLDDAGVAAVLTHIRRSWGNDAAPVSEVDVAHQRGGIQR